MKADLNFTTLTSTDLWMATAVSIKKHRRKTFKQNKPSKIGKKNVGCKLIKVNRCFSKTIRISFLIRS